MNDSSIPLVITMGLYSPPPGVRWEEQMVTPASFELEHPKAIFHRLANWKKEIKRTWDDGTQLLGNHFCFLQTNSVTQFERGLLIWKTQYELVCQAEENAREQYKVFIGQKMNEKQREGEETALLFGGCIHPEWAEKIDFTSRCCLLCGREESV